MRDPALALASLPPLLRWGVLALLIAAIVTPLSRIIHDGGGLRISQAGLAA